MTDSRLPSDHAYPLHVTVPTGAVLADAVHVPMGSVPRYSRIFAVEGHLQALSLGTFSISLRDMMDDSEFGRIQWTSAGDAFGTDPSGNAIDKMIQGAGAGIKINVVGVGTGALNCALIFWMRMAI